MFYNLPYLQGLKHQVLKSSSFYRTTWFYKQIKILGQISSFEFFLGWLFASQKTGYPGFRYRSSRFPRFAQSSGHLWCPYYPCHERNSKLNLLNSVIFQIRTKKRLVSCNLLPEFDTSPPSKLK